jgi:hypothetical protein
LIGHQLAILPDTNNIWEVKNRSVFVDGLSGWFCDIGFDVADFEGLSGWLAATKDGSLVVRFFNKVREMTARMIGHGGVHEVRTRV